MEGSIPAGIQVCGRCQFRYDQIEPTCSRCGERSSSLTRQKGKPLLFFLGLLVSLGAFSLPALIKDLIARFVFVLTTLLIGGWLFWGLFRPGPMFRVRSILAGLLLGMNFGYFSFSVFLWGALIAAKGFQ